MGNFSLMRSRTPSAECEKMFSESNVIVQLSLSENAVLIISAVPLLVSCWEGNDKKDSSLKSQFIKKYCPMVFSEVLRETVEVIDPQETEITQLRSKTTKSS